MVTVGTQGERQGKGTERWGLTLGPVVTLPAGSKGGAMQTTDL